MRFVKHNSPPLLLSPSPHLACLLITASIFILGCNSAPAGPKRGKLEGNVTLNGKPVAKGHIRFLAVDPNGTNAAAEIVAGKYAIPDTQGPTKGKYRVEFSVPSDTKKKIPNDDIPGQWIEIHPESLPAKYHTASTMTLDYDPDHPQPHDFQLIAP